MEVNFKGKVVLVTGASSGIGKTIALLFAECGAKLSLVGQNEANLREVAAQCAHKRGNTPLIVLADLSTDGGCETVAKKTIVHFNRLDVLVNNAGVSARTTIQTTDMAIFDRVFNLDVRGVYNLTRLLVPELIKTKGNIVNISSVSGTKVAISSLPYSMAKAALDHFSNLIALELAPLGVRVNTVSPGITRWFFVCTKDVMLATPAVKAATPQEFAGDLTQALEHNNRYPVAVFCKVSNIVKRIINCSEEEYQAWLSEAVAGVPMGEVCTGEDVARMVVHLASDLSRLVTGTVVPVDGGVRFGNVNSAIRKQLK